MHNTNTKLHNTTRVFLKTQNSTLGIHQFLPAKIRRFTLLNAVFYVVLNVKRELLPTELMARIYKILQSLL